MLDREQALARAVRYCARAEHCLFDLGRKFWDWGVPEEWQEQIRSYLLTEGYIDEARYARAYARDKARFASWGRARIERELSMRHIPSAYIRDALAELGVEVEATDRLRNLLERKLGTLPQGLDARKRRERLLRFALYRGHDYEESMACISDLEKGQD